MTFHQPHPRRAMQAATVIRHFSAARYLRSGAGSDRLPRGHLRRGAAETLLDRRAKVEMNLVPMLQHPLLDLMALGIVRHAHRPFGHAADDRANISVVLPAELKIFAQVYLEISCVTRNVP